MSHSGTARVPPMLSKMFYCIFWSAFLYSGVFWVAKHESEVILTEFKMTDPRLWTQYVKLNLYSRLTRQILFHCIFRAEYFHTRVFRFVYHKTKVIFAKFKMADPRWRTKCVKSNQIPELSVYRGFPYRCSLI